MSDETKEPWVELVSYLLATRDSNSGLVARVRRGISGTTEHYAYADVLPFVVQGTKPQPLLRASALVVSYPDIAQTKPGENRRLGASFLQLSRAVASSEKFTVDPARPDVVASRLRSLALQDLDEAANTFNRLLSLGAKANFSLDFYALTRRLLHWGNGHSPQSLKTREATLSEYYLAVPPADTRIHNEVKKNVPSEN